MTRVRCALTSGQVRLPTRDRVRSMAQGSTTLKIAVTRCSHAERLWPDQLRRSSAPSPRAVGYVMQDNRIILRHLPYSGTITGGCLRRHHRAQASRGQLWSRLLRAFARWGPLFAKYVRCLGSEIFDAHRRGLSPTTSHTALKTVQLSANCRQNHSS